MNKVLYNQKEVCELLNISVPILYELERKGKINRIDGFTSPRYSVDRIMEFCQCGESLDKMYLEKLNNENKKLMEENQRLVAFINSLRLAVNEI